MAARAGGFPPQSTVNMRAASDPPPAPRSDMIPIFLAAATALLTAQAVETQPLVVRVARLAHAGPADLARAAPIAAPVRVRDSAALRPEEAANLRTGYRRFLIE